MSVIDKYMLDEAYGIATARYNELVKTGELDRYIQLKNVMAKCERNIENEFKRLESSFDTMTDDILNDPYSPFWNWIRQYFDDDAIIFSWLLNKYRKF